MHALATRGTEALDELTLRRAQHGDPRAWRALIEHHQQAVHALIWRMLAGRARHRAEDLAQETFVRVLRALPKFDPSGPAKLSTWILTIAARLTLNELRRPELASLPGLESEPASHERVEASIDRRRLGTAIAEGVGKLSDANRAVLVLREYHDLDYAEIAEVLELDVGTVKSRLARARAALREHLLGVVPELAETGRRP
jgi:RNA polymerase sigma-70 factor (ECF subfamily)